MGAAREVAPWLRVVVMMTVDEAGNCLDGASAEKAAVRLIEFGADAVGYNTIDVHVGRVRAKLAGSRARIETVRGTGYRMVEA